MKREKTHMPPDKCCKYELLDEFGLLSPGYLNRAIHRYRWQDRFKVIDDIIRDFNGVDDRFYVVKFVPRRLCFLLPNIRLYKLADVERLRDALASLDPHFEEVWFCKTDVGNHALSVAGRIVIDRRMAEDSQIIEQVWRCSPRLIQDIGKGFAFPYAMATRPGWGWNFKIKKIYIPTGDECTEVSLCSGMGMALREIYYYRDQLNRFEDFLFGCGCDAISIEYKLEGSKLQFIDWDTHQDPHVLDCWKRKGFN